MIMGLEDFKQEVIDQVEWQISERKWKHYKDKDIFIIIKSNFPDQKIEEAFISRIDQKINAYYMADKDENIEHLVEELGCNGLTIVYDRMEQKWAKEQLKICRQLTWKQRDHAPVICAMYTVPPDEEPRLGIRLPQVRHFSYNDDESLSEFLQEVLTKGD